MTSKATVSDAALEEACRAVVCASGKDPDQLVPRPRGQLGQIPLWKSYERLIRPALEAVLEEGHLIPVPTEGSTILPERATEYMRRAGMDLALSVSLSKHYGWLDYMGDLWTTMVEAARKE